MPIIALLLLALIVASGAVASPADARSRLKTLQVGETAEACIQARPRWNYTGIKVERNGHYRITAKGTWWDKDTERPPEGGGSNSRILRLSEWLRRMPHENWFKLICAIDTKKTTAFAFDAQPLYSATADGELTCYANDVWFTYGNNSGAIQMKVERVEAANP